MNPSSHNECGIWHYHIMQMGIKHERWHGEAWWKTGTGQLRHYNIIYSALCLSRRILVRTLQFRVRINYENWKVNETMASLLKKNMKSWTWTQWGIRSSTTQRTIHPLRFNYQKCHISQVKPFIPYLPLLLLHYSKTHKIIRMTPKIP